MKVQLATNKSLSNTKKSDFTTFNQKERHKMNRADRREYMKAYYQAHKAEAKEYYQARREDRKAYQKAYREAHKEELKAYKKAYHEAHKEELNAYQKAWEQSHKEERNAYMKSDTNSLGKTKHSVRSMSGYYLFNVLNHTKIDGYEIHHCFGYNDYKRFIYIPKELHLEIHQFLRDNGIDADSDHYSKIEHLIVGYLKCNERHVLIMNNNVGNHA